MGGVSGGENAGQEQLHVDSVGQRTSCWGGLSEPSLHLSGTVEANLYLNKKGNITSKRIQPTKAGHLVERACAEASGGGLGGCV